MTLEARMTDTIISNLFRFVDGHFSWILSYLVFIVVGIHNYSEGQRLTHVNHGRFGKCFIVEKNGTTQDIVVVSGIMN